MVGEKAPDFTLQNQDGVNITLAQKLKTGPVILSFYRGDWCRHCNREVQHIEAIQDKLTEMNVSVIAIAPQHPSDAKNMADKNNLSFELLSDTDFKVIDAYKLKFEMSDDIKQVYLTTFNRSLPDHTANKSWELPVPATFVINQEGVITARYVETDYSQRLTSEELIDLLQTS
ncbi:MAG: peroxiredoxin family protein [Candidatus Kariarchaeaceae archaeon]